MFAPPQQQQHLQHLQQQQHGEKQGQQHRRSQQQQFVRVSFDFDYASEEGKRVFMREGEVLLLINKTNQDWWQVRERVNTP